TRPLAHGGMGIVWVARHLQLDVDIAVKLMYPEHTGSAAWRLRFEREAKIAAQLKIHNAAQVYDYGLDEGVPYIVMELLEGEELKAHLRRSGPLSVPATLRIIAPVCAALSSAHAAGLIHRDLKPGNIFLSRSPQGDCVKLLDLGLAKCQSPQLGDA